MIDAVLTGTVLADAPSVPRRTVTIGRLLVVLIVASPVPALAEGQPPMVGVQVLGASGTHVENVDILRHHELRTFVRLGRLQPVVWVSSSDARTRGTPTISSVLGYGGGLGIIERYRGLNVELAGGVSRRALVTDCATARSSGSTMVCGPFHRWGPRVRLGVTVEGERPVGAFATGFELIAERVELAPGASGILVLAGIVLAFGIHGR